MTPVLRAKVDAAQAAIADAARAVLVLRGDISAATEAKAVDALQNAQDALRIGRDELDERDRVAALAVFTDLRAKEGGVQEPIRALHAALAAKDADAAAAAVAELQKAGLLVPPDAEVAAVAQAPVRRTVKATARVAPAKKRKR